MNPSKKRLFVVALALVSLTLPLAAGSAKAVVRKKGSYSGGGGGPQEPPGVSSLGPTATPLDHNNLAVSFGRHGNWEAAVREHEIALNGDPYNATFRMNLSGAYLRYGQALAAQHNWKVALQKFHMAVYVDSNNAAAVEGADTCVRAMGKGDPNDSNVHRRLGEDYEGEGNYPEAIAEFRHTVRITDLGPDHANLGRVLFKQGQTVPARAVEGFNEMKIAFNKDWAKDQQFQLADAHYLVAETLKDLAYKARDGGRTDTALKRMQNAGIEYRRAATLWNGKRLDAARGLVEVSRESVAINPNSFDNHLSLAAAYQLTGDFERAKKEYEVCWQLQPNNPKLAAARISYHFAVVTSPGVSPVLVAASVQKVEDMLRRNPNDAMLLYIYGRGKDDLGEHDIAMRAYNAAYQINPYITPDLPGRLGMAPLVGLAPTRPAGAPPIAVANGTAPGGQPAAPGGQPVAPVGQPTAPGAQPPPGVLPVAAGGQPVIQDKASPQAAATSSNLAKLKQDEDKINAGDFDGAKKSLLAMVESDPKEGKAWYLLGVAQEKKGELDDASVNYRQAKYLLPDDKEADAAMKRVAAQRVAPFLNNAAKHLAENNPVAAKDDLQEALSVSQDDVSIHQKYLDVLKKLGDQKEVDRESNTIQRLMNPPPPALPKGKKAPDF